MQTFWLPFITGLTTGGISCFAVQGSLLATSLAIKTEENASNKLKKKSLIYFLIAKLLAYSLLGFLLGSLGSKLIISPKTQGIFQILIGIYMLITAANIANIHPFFKNFIIRPPKFIFRILKNKSNIKSFFTPILLGILTVLIPCGVSQGMMLLAVSSSTPFAGASILFGFILGTIPMFFVLGLAATELFKHKAFNIIAAIIMAILGLISINSGQILRGSVHTFQNYYAVLTRTDLVKAPTSIEIKDGFQIITIDVSNHGYKANANTLKLGQPTRLILKTNNVFGCARAFAIPDYNISKVLPQTGEEIIEFTPTKLGNLTYTCSMGMYSGSFNVTE